MAGFVEGGKEEGLPAFEVDGLAEFDGAKEAEHLSHVVFGEEGTDGGGRAEAGAAVEVVGVFLLDLCGVEHDDAGDVGGGGGAVDGAVVAAAGEHGESAAVVEVAVGEDDGVEFVEIGGEFGVEQSGLFAAALEHAEVEKDPPPGGFDEVAGACDRPGRTDEADSHSQSIAREGGGRAYRACMRCGLMVGWLVWLGVLAGLCSGQTVRVEVGAELGGVADGKPGRVVLFLIGPEARVSRRARPIDAFFEQDPQPLFGVEVTGAEWVAGGEGGMELGPETAGFAGRGPARLGDLPAGQYRAQVALIFSHGDVGDWKLTAGNVYSEPVVVRLAAGETAVVRLTRTTQAREFPREVAGVEEFVVRSALLSAHYGRDFYLRAGVRRPGRWEAGRKYPAVYEVPGFGGDHGSVAWPNGGLGRSAATRQLLEEAFYIVLDPSSPTGHSLFLDSDNNGPWSRALIEELLPALETRYPLVSGAEGRVLRGHSSGGWTVLWLALRFPETFGACWSTSPDPVDFRRFERVDIYAQRNAYVTEAGEEIASARIGGRGVTMTVRQENTMEDVLGPGLTSAQQWASWQACWGRRRTDGGIRPLFDVVSGEIDPEEAETYRRYDLGALLRQDPGRYGRLWRERVRLAVGTADDYYLEEAVELLAADLERLAPAAEMPGPGYIRFVEGATHGSIYETAAVRGIAGEMLEHFRGAGLVRGR